MTKGNTWGKKFIWLTFLGHNPSLRIVRAGTEAGTRGRQLIGSWLVSSYSPGQIRNGLSPPVSNSPDLLSQTWPQVSLVEAALQFRIPLPRRVGLLMKLNQDMSSVENKR